MSHTSAVYRRRRIVAIAALAAVAAVIVFAVTPAHRLQRRRAAVARRRRRARSAPRRRPRRAPPELPRGGRRILPDFRVVAYYGAPQDRQLGALGIGSPPRWHASWSARRSRFGRKSRPVLPAMELIAVVAAAHPGPGRPLQPAPARLGDPPLPEGRAQGQVAADPGHPARPLGLLHRDQAAAQVAQGARRRARAGPRVADGPGRGPGRRDRQRERARGQRHDRLAGPARAAREPAAEAAADPPVHRRHDPRVRAQGAQGPGLRAQRRRLRHAGPEGRQVQGVRGRRPGSGTASSSSTRRTRG